VSLPERQYRLAGDILARALEDEKESDRTIPPAVAKAAHEAGTSIAARARAEGVDQAGGSRLEAVAAVLATQGYEPRIDDATITLANCPFHALSREHTALVCGMNLELISGVTTELGLEDIEVTLDPGPDRCCVRLADRGGRERQLSQRQR
jgi:predicted ArsR family transcriptional regulator